MAFFLLNDGTKIHYVAYDKNSAEIRQVDVNSPCLIILHGGPGFDHKHMLNFWTKLTVFSQVLFIDQRGNGLSDRSDSSHWNLVQWAEDLAQIIRILALKFKPVLVGSSFGSYVLQQFMALYPSMARKIILTDADAHFNLNRFLKGVRKKAELMCLDADKAVYAAKNWVEQNESVDFDAYVKYCLPLFDNNPERSMLDDLAGSIETPEVMSYFNRHELLRFDFRDKLNNVTCPVMIIAGDINPYHSKESAEELASAIPSTYAHLVIYKGVGAPTYNHRPNEILSDILTFLRK